MTCDGIVGAATVGRAFVVEGADESAASFSAEWSSIADPGAWGRTLEQTGRPERRRSDSPGSGWRRSASAGPRWVPSSATLDDAVCPAANEHAAATQQRRVITICGGIQKTHQLVVGPSAASAGSTVDGFVVLAYAP